MVVEDAIQHLDSRKGFKKGIGIQRRYEDKKERRSSRKEGTERKNMCVHARAPSWTPPQIHPGSISTWRRGINKGKGRAGKGREWKGRAGKGREGKSRGATYNHPLPRCTLSPSQSGPLPVPVSILPLGTLPPSQIIGPPTQTKRRH